MESTEEDAGEARATFKKARVQSEASKRRAARRRPLAAWAGRALLRAASLVPLRGLHALGRTVGALGSRLPLREVKASRTNAALCFPDWTPARRAQLVRRSLGETACMLLEVSHGWYRPQAELLARVVEVRGEEHVRAILARGRGCIVAVPHLGAWEIMGIYAGAHYPVTALYRAPRVKDLEATYTGGRSRSGTKLVPAGGAGVRALFEALGRGELAVLLPDQDPGRGAGVFVPFFGVLASTSTLLPRIASRSGAGVVLAFAERLPRAAGYRIHVQPGSDAIGGGDLEQGARALNADIERLVRLAPEQYLWSYKRFKSRPPGEPDRYPDS